MLTWVTSSAQLRRTAKDQKWFRHPGIDVFGPEKRDDGFWECMRKFYFYDPAPTVRASKAPLLAIFGERYVRLTGSTSFRPLR